MPTVSTIFTTDSVENRFTSIFTGKTMSTAASMTIEELIEEFDDLGDWADQCEVLIDMGRELPDMPPELKTEESKVHGCQSNVWMVASVSERRIPHDRTDRRQRRDDRPRPADRHHDGLLSAGPLRKSTTQTSKPFSVDSAWTDTSAPLERTASAAWSTEFRRSPKKPSHDGWPQRCRRLSCS